MLKSIIVMLAGGIGNQLFQTIFGLSLAEKFSAAAFINTEKYRNYSYHHEPEILNLGLDESIFSNKAPHFEIKSTLILREGVVSSIDEIRSLPANCETLILDGYWQSENFLSPSVIKSCYEKLCKKYEVDAESRRGDAKTGNPSRIGVHIRRRDYDHMGITRNEYYSACLRFITERTGIRSLSLYSDEPNASHHLLQALGYRDVEVVRTGDDWMDLYSLSHHKYLLMANSTYSWWGARFGEERQNKLILRPAPWLTINSAFDPCPARWIPVNDSVETGIGVNPEVSNQLYNSLRLSAHEFTVISDS